MAAPGGLKMGLSLAEMQRKQTPVIHSLGAGGGAYIGPDGQVKTIGSQAVVKPPETSPEAKLMADRDKFAPGSEMYKVLDNILKKKGEWKPDSGGSGAALPQELSAADKANVDFYAKQEVAGMKDWRANFRGKDLQVILAQVMRRVPEMATELGLSPMDVGSNRATYTALVATQRDITKRQEAVDQFSSKVEKDMKTLDNLLDSASTGSPMLISKPINALRRQFSDPALSQLDLAAKQVGTEYERLITGGTLSVAQLHVGAQEDAKKLINGDMTPKQARAVMDTMRFEIGNARAAAKESTDRISSKIKELGRSAPKTLEMPSESAIDAELRRRGR